MYKEKLGFEVTEFRKTNMGQAKTGWLWVVTRDKFTGNIG
ncbi:hypothetical protein SOV_06980 [Sporomusa ovata DSM 2662]|uniref:Uncharacterized protein n=1 Tax=Sporomusa ovata TaxID=2378 RepID=A0A0U1KXK3_9FIRM|nr:hypothetical protein SOV_1c00360 [Sporomusa ovata DSM 2662]CQR71995.1 hypothetical protein SpAn4DRAFT_5236 [Sporomusa ovata]